MSNPYAPPAVSDSESRSLSGVNTGRPVRIAAFLFVLAAGFAVTTWGIECFWELMPTWQAVLEASVQIALGMGLLRFGRRAIPATITILGAAALYRLVFHIQLAEHVGLRGLALPAVFDVLNFSPPLLLLLGRPGRTRCRVALVAFFLGRAADLALLTVTISVLR
jgi:hypothetical protein